MQFRDKDDKNLLEQGFTLVELLIVVVILGILAGIVVFAVGNLTNNASSNACGTEADTVGTASEAYRAQNAAYPTMAQLVSSGLLRANPKNWNTSTATPPAAPAAGQFSYNSSTGAVTKGASCT
jgi:general secretion pathway protein G